MRLIKARHAKVEIVGGSMHVCLDLYFPQSSLNFFLDLNLRFSFVTDCCCLLLNCSIKQEYGQHTRQEIVRGKRCHQL